MAGEQVEAVAHNCAPCTRLLTHSSQCQGPRPLTRPRSPVPSPARLVCLSQSSKIFRFSDLKEMKKKLFKQ